MRPKKFGICLFCDNSFQKRKSTSIYCSRSCQAYDLARRGVSCKKPKTGKNVVCQHCLIEFYVRQYRFKNGNVKYCSRKCLAKVHLPKYADFRFKPLGKPPHKYKQITINGKKIREHRHIMQCHLGRKLKTWEHVHHINGNSYDNRIENLIVLSNSDHQKIEYQDRKKIISS